VSYLYRYPACKVVAINVNEETEVANYAVALDAEGRLIDHLILPPIPDTRNDAERSRFEKTISNFVLQASTEKDQVHAMVVNSSAGHVSRKMMELVTELVDTRLLEDLRNMVNDQDSDDEDDHIEPHVVYSYVNDEVAQIYSNSARAEREFPDYPPTLRQAIALGRYLQDPLDEYCSLWIEGAGKRGEEARELRMLTIHPLQAHVGAQQLLKRYERLFIEKVMDCGVDLNKAAAHEHCAARLRFVAGLGPRKAEYLRQKVSKSGFIEQRKDLEKKRYLEPKVSEHTRKHALENMHCVLVIDD
jgi:transcription elongation factor SPT6